MHDALLAMLDKVRVADHIKGVVAHLIPPNQHIIAMVKVLPMCFEVMAGLKINFHKCEVVTMGMGQGEGSGWQTYSIASWALSQSCIWVYLSPIKIYPLLCGTGPLCSKVAKRVCPWRGKFMSSGARLILTNFSLSSLTMFTMGMFLLANGVHAKLYNPYSKFFWEGAGTKRKYHMVKWAVVCSPKKFGGLGIINSKLMNIALLSKWIWKSLQNATSLWAEVLMDKYLPDGSFVECKVHGSPFWNRIQVVKLAIALGAKFEARNDKSIRFLFDS